MEKKHVYVIGFIISAFFTTSFLITVVVSLLNPVPTSEMIKVNPYLSWMDPQTAYMVHVSGNVFFTAIAIFFALDFWKRYAK